MTGTDIMPSGAIETFTGTNGATPNATNWASPTTNEGTGGGFTIQSNQARLRTGTASGNRLSVRLNKTALADGEMVFDWTVPADGTVYTNVFVRSGPLLNGDGGFYYSFSDTGITVGKFVPNYTAIDLATATYSYTPGQVLRTKIAVFGARTRARTWLASASEPTSVWDIDFTNSGTYAANGYWGFSASSASAGSKDFFIDNVDLHDTITPSQATLAATGGVTPSGFLLNVTSKPFTGGVTPSGVLVKTRAVPRTFSGAITPTGVLVKSVPKFFSGAVTPTGVLVKRVPKFFSGAVTPTGPLTKTGQRRFAGAVTPTGVTGTMFIGRIFGRPGVVVMNLIRAAEVAIRYRRV